MLLFANNARSALRVGVAPTDTTLRLETGTGDLFPLPGANESFFVTLIEAGSVEIMECTARSGDELTVIRARDGTDAIPFSIGAVVDHRATAEVFRRMSVENIVGQPGGVAPVGMDGRLPVALLPAEALTQQVGDTRYLRKADYNAANGPLQLDSAAKVPFEKLPSEMLTQAEGDSLYIPLSAKGTANGVAGLDADGKLPSGLLRPGAIDLSAYAPLLDPVFTAGITVGTRVTAGEITVTGVSRLSGVEANAVSTSGTVTIKGGAPRGKLTFATTAPSGTPEPGDEWVQYET